MNSFTPDSKLYSDLATLFTTALEVATIDALQRGTLVAAVQPISSNAIRAGKASNGGVGNALGLRDVNQTWWSFRMAWYNAEDDDVAYATARPMYDKIRAVAADAGATLEYLFMNDANGEQPVIASYGKENVRRLQEVRRTYDPEMVFQHLVPGGQKIPE